MADIQSPRKLNTKMNTEWCRRRPRRGLSVQSRRRRRERTRRRPVFLPKDVFKFFQIDSEYFSTRKSRPQTLFRVSDSNTLWVRYC
ncbi:hypothetical protein BQ8794_50683 [Mesorhizobium prunaredense]|uniref:Uncharacterized protein n=1 Tax=Mesorhizobium prunaredense TaxID=1631249 RepID=A0A1R3VJH5_9HYPH|nr:hypothetical protein BQ8794_50683 [Mesorhizobium prunaredense]